MMNAHAKIGPDFIIIGAMKAATSTLADQLSQQDDIFITKPKEPSFFAQDAVFAKGWDWYARLFSSANTGDLKGEASTDYTKRPTYPDVINRMRACGVKPKIIYIIRNPLERARSHFLHEVSQGVMSGTLEEAFATYPELETYGRYGDQISPYVEEFGVDSIYLTSLEQIKQNPDDELARVGQHIGAIRPLVWDHGAKPQNVSAERIRRLPLHNLLIESAFATRMRRVLVPQAIRHRIRDARVIGTERPAIPDHLVPALSARFLEDRARLAQYFPDHPSLTLCYRFDHDA